MSTVAFVIAISVTGCSSSQPSVHVFVDHPDGLVDTPVVVKVSGVPSRALVTLQLSATDNRGVRWASIASFRASQSGEVSLAQQAPVSASYTGVEPMGLFWSMRPVRGPADDTDFVYGPTGFVATFSVSLGGREVASASLERRAGSPDVQEQSESVATTGLYGEYFARTAATIPAPAVVVLGGSEGGLATVGLAKLLASEGFPTLALAYFGEPGLPSGIEDVPLEYFSDAVRWLARQPGVDPNHVDVLGISRGAEAALLVASYLPPGIHAVIGAAPTDVVNPPEPVGRGGAWTLAGTELQGLTPTLAAAGAAGDEKILIPVARFDGPMLLICGSDDGIWPSCASANTIEQERRVVSADDVVLRLPGAGHGAASLVPFISEASTTTNEGAAFDRMGGTPAADGVGRSQAWGVLLDFLRR